MDYFSFQSSLIPEFDRLFAGCLDSLDDLNAYCLLSRTRVDTVAWRLMDMAMLFFDELPKLHESPVAIYFGVARVRAGLDPDAKYVRHRMPSEEQYCRVEKVLRKKFKAATAYHASAESFLEFRKQEDAVWARKLRRLQRFTVLEWRKSVVKYDLAKL